MALSSERPKRKSTGGRYVSYRKKRVFNKRSTPTLTKLGAEKKVTTRTMGGHTKQRIYFAETANIYDPKTKKCHKAKITSVVDNPANRHFIRQNILTKGAVVETDKGRARVTSKPGQEGTVNAVLI